ncbi:MAG: DUF4139 domain-containing protein [Prevotellaceae bacterium]|jgi:uncharacterized protein (TIGR02231 family)|nr:DUF4139 domain-containing protein [Prevotellaceae bacterium]
MRKLLCVSLLIYGISINTLNAQDKSVSVSSSISGVTVFLRGAEVQRAGSLQLKGGAQQVVFDNLPENIDVQTIQVSGVGNFTILGVSHRVNHLQSPVRTKEAAALEDSLKWVKNQITNKEAAIAVLNDEQAMLKANQYIGGSNVGVKTLELKAFVDYYHTQLSGLSTRRISVQAEVKTLVEIKERLENQLRGLQQRPQRSTGEIVVDVTATAATKASFSVSYFTYQAGWTPNYDLRSAELHKPITLTYKARVYQSTGEEWKNVKPVLSTGNPTVNSTKPTLVPWYLSFYKPPVTQYSAYNNIMLERSSLKSKRSIDALDEMVVEDAKEIAVSSADYTTVNESQTSVEFAVDAPYTIAGDGTVQTVELAVYSLPAQYEYYAVRKLEKDVFLLAKVAGWEKLNLLAGEANLFFEGKYVGKSYIETRQTDDTLSLSLGRDNNITVTRIRKKDFSEKQSYGNNMTETREWELTVHNKKKQSVIITLEDQIPVSVDKEIKVDAVNVSGAQLNEPLGKLTWRYTLKPSESRSMTVKYTVKHPKDKTVILE